MIGKRRLIGLLDSLMEASDLVEYAGKELENAGLIVDGQRNRLFVVTQTIRAVHLEIRGNREVREFLKVKKK
jgi:hypothetical protein